MNEERAHNYCTTSGNGADNAWTLRPYCDFIRRKTTVSVSASTSLTNTGSALLLTLSGPGGWGEGGQMTHAYVGEAGENS